MSKQKPGSPPQLVVAAESRSGVSACEGTHSDRSRRVTRPTVTHLGSESLGLHFDRPGLPSSFGVALPGFSGPPGAPSPSNMIPKIEGPTPTLILAIRGALTRRTMFSCLFNEVVIGGKHGVLVTQIQVKQIKLHRNLSLRVVGYPQGKTHILSPFWLKVLSFSKIILLLRGRRGTSLRWPPPFPFPNFHIGPLVP